jgi:hypothetical protein
VGKSESDLIGQARMAEPTPEQVGAVIDDFKRKTLDAMKLGQKVRVRGDFGVKMTKIVGRDGQPQATGEPDGSFQFLIQVFPLPEAKPLHGKE